MRTHRNIVLRKVFNDGKLTGPTLQLDHHCAALLHQADRIIQRLIRAGVAHERHVGHQKSPRQSARNDPGVIDDVIDPAETRPKIIRALEMLENKRETTPYKKHGCIPL